LSCTAPSAIVSRGTSTFDAVSRFVLVGITTSCCTERRSASWNRLPDTNDRVAVSRDTTSIAIGCGVLVGLVYPTQVLLGRTDLAIRRLAIRLGILGATIQSRLAIIGPPRLFNVPSRPVSGRRVLPSEGSVSCPTYLLACYLLLLILYSQQGASVDIGV